MHGPHSRGSGSSTFTFIEGLPPRSAQPGLRPTCAGGRGEGRGKECRHSPSRGAEQAQAGALGNRGQASTTRMFLWSAPPGHP